VHEAGQREETALRLASQKKVTFRCEQLAFSMHVDNAGLFAGEQPAPITVSNGVQRAKSRSQSKERKQTSSAKKVRPNSAKGK